jgi:hypothetical protein
MNHNMATWLTFCICTSFLPLVRGDALPGETPTLLKYKKALQFQFTDKFKVKDLPLNNTQDKSPKAWALYLFAPNH